MKKVYLVGNNKLGKWSLSQDLAYIKLILKKLDCKIVNNIFLSNIIYSPWYNSFLSKRFYYFLRFIKKLKKIKIIVTISNDVSVQMPKKIFKLFDLVDNWIVPNKKLYNFLLNYKRNLNVTLIPFYVDKKKFIKINKTREEICKILNIEHKHIDKKILIGSFQRDSLGSDLSKPKWQKNPDLLIKILHRFPKEDILLILAGPRRHYLINQCRNQSIPYLFFGNEWYIDNNKDDLKINNLENDKISLLYNLVDVYIITSKSEGGAKQVLESSLTKTFIVSTNVGLAPDILHNDLIYPENNIEKLVNFIHKILKNENKKQQYINYNYKIGNLTLDEDNLLKKYKLLFF